jgi:hypothetical protein
VPEGAAREVVVGDAAKVLQSDPVRVTESVPIREGVVAAEADREKVKREERDDRGEREKPRDLVGTSTTPPALPP